MISTLFLRFLVVSITVGIVIAIVLSGKTNFGKKYTAKWNYWVWLVLAVRLVLPVTMPEEAAAIVVQVPQTNIKTVSANQIEWKEVVIDKEWLKPQAKDNVYTAGATAEEKNTLIAEGPRNNYLTAFLSQISLQSLAAFVWLLGVAVYLMYHVIAHWVFRGRIQRFGKEPTNAGIGYLTAEIAKEMGIRRRIRIRICCHVASPLMMGLFSPTLVLPREDYTESELQIILRHELTHCKRNDLFYKVLLLCANALHWYNPFVWLMCKEANGDLERACDEEVLRGASFDDRKLYTKAILNGISENIRQQSNLTTSFYGGKKELKHRLTTILDMKKKRSGRIALCVTFACVLAISSLVACSGADNDGESGQASVGAESVTGETDTKENSTESPVQQDAAQLVFEDIPEEDIYEVKENGETTYYATRYGIYRVTSGGSECIYDKGIDESGFSGIEPHMTVYGNRLYFKTDVSYKGINLDWMDDGIRYVDLDTLDSDIVMSYLSASSNLIDFRVGDGYLVLSTKDSTGEEYEKMLLLQEPGKQVYQGKAVEDLTEEERREYGLETSKWLVENPGKLISVANRTFAETFALLDMDGNGSVEEISLQPDETRNIAYAPLDSYLLKEGDKVLKEGFAENMCNDMWAISPNGKDILLVLFSYGPSEDPYTLFYRYENSSLIGAGGFGTDIRACEITEDGVISGVIRHDVIQTDFIIAQWRLNEQKQLVQIPREAYEFVTLNEVKMLQALTLHTNPGGGETFVLEPQTVKFTKVSGDDKWIMLETLDGVCGWLEVIDYMTVEDHKGTLEVFDVETMIFAG